MDIKSVEKIVKTIQVNLFKNSNSHAIGMFKSNFKGLGIKFKEHRVYEPGDDTRFIDWKLLARTNQPYVKTFEEDRNVHITVVIDASLSMFTGFRGVSKLQAAIEITSLLYLLSKQTKDVVQTIIIAEELVTLPPKTGEEGIVFFIDSLKRLNLIDEEGKVNLAYLPKKFLNMEDKLRAVKQQLYRKKEVIILSDFHQFIPIESLRSILFRRNLHCFQLTSPLDEANSVPFSIFGFTYDGMNEKKNEYVQSKIKLEEDKLQSILGKKLKKLKVEDEYLNTFVKEMI